MRTKAIVFGVLMIAGAALGQNAPATSPAPAPATASAPAPAPLVVPPAGAPSDPLRPGGPHIAPGRAEPDPCEPLYGYSLMAVQPPKPKTHELHGLITIVVDESSQQQADQTLNTDKKYNNTANINALLDPKELAQLRLTQGQLTNLTLLDIASKQKFDGTGKFARNDKLSLKIEAEIIDVKPNGTLTLEARKTVDKNNETMSTVLSGVCRPEDITANNTVFSSQLANLTLITRSEGQVNDAAKKGLIPRVLETLFAF